jgi:hypothetical protein
MNMQDHVPSMHVVQPGERLPMVGLERLPDAGYFTPFLPKSLKYSSRMPVDILEIPIYSSSEQVFCYWGALADSQELSTTNRILMTVIQ